MTNTILNGDDLLKNIHEIEIKNDEIIGMSSYDEIEILEKIKKFGDDNVKILYKAAVQMAVIGTGNKSFGKIKHNNKEIEIIDILKKFEIKYNGAQNERYDTGTITVRRLIRIFRYHIRNYIERSGRTSYLFNKYSTHERKYASICFPGAEHLVENTDQANYLLQTVGNLDSVQNTNIKTKVKFVLQARFIKYDLSL